MVELSDVRKTYVMEAVDVHALRGIDLTLRQGEFTAIMGASGSGKSTLLNVVGCLDQPTGGVYRLDGERVDGFNEERLAECRRMKLGFVFQSFNLLYRATALENVELPMVYQGVRAGERLQRARQALQTVGLGDRLDHLPTQLSGGQQQRVALARALVTRPRLLLADEPTGNLDSKTADEVLDLLVRVHAQGNLTVAMVTHDPDVAACAHRIVILHDGRVVHDQVSPSRGGPAIPHIRSIGVHGVAKERECE
ncbi:MAG: ABC transporter ATP-binding protein [Planctomycetes bacterium]|nr:ABC transporter ATP-binding protein [Planctomycetota bacterium]